MRKKWHWSKSTGWRQGKGWGWGECGDKGETKGVVKGEGREKEEVQGKNEGETEGVGAGKSEGEGREKSEGEGDGRVKGGVCTKLFRKLLRLPKLKASNLWQDTMAWITEANTTAYKLHHINIACVLMSPISFATEEIEHACTQTMHNTVFFHSKRT